MLTCLNSFYAKYTKVQGALSNLKAYPTRRATLKQKTKDKAMPRTKAFQMYFIMLNLKEQGKLNFCSISK